MVFNKLPQFFTRSFLTASAFLALLFSGCSLSGGDAAGGQSERQNSSANQNGVFNQTVAAEAAKPSAENACRNKYYPVADGRKAVFDIDNAFGKSKASMTQQQDAGNRTFVQQWQFDKLEMKQIWQCTADGIVAPNLGSSLESQGGVKSESKHISGVTIPNESEIAVGKTWTAKYEVTTEAPTLKQPITSPVTVENKILSLDDEVKTAGGTFRAMKVESVATMNLTIDGKTISVPPIKSYSWYAPNIGLVKTDGTLPGAGKSTLEYAGAN